MTRTARNTLAVLLVALATLALADQNGPRLSPGDTGGTAGGRNITFFARAGGHHDVSVDRSGTPLVPSGRYGPTLTR